VEGAVRTLGAFVAAGFSLNGALAIRAWWRERDERHAAIAVALGLLALVCLGRQVNRLTGYHHHWLIPLNAAMFLMSGYALLLFRHTFLPVRRAYRQLAFWSVVAGTVIAVAAPIPNPPQQHLARSAQLAVLVILGIWCVTVGEPVGRFWRAGAGRPAVQQVRLRALAAGYGGLVGILITAIVALPTGSHPAIFLTLTAVAVALVPALYASLAAPDFLRILWRGRQQHELMAATDRLLQFTSERSLLAEPALRSAIALVGGDGGAIVDGTGEVLATVEMTIPDAIRIAARSQVRGALVESDTGWVVGTPINTSAGRGMLLVRSGPFTPIFGSKEAAVLDHFAIALATALDRVRMSEQLQGQIGLHDQLLQAMSDLGQGFVIARDRRIVYVNDAMTRITGYTTAQLMAMPSYFELVADSQWPAVNERRRQRALGQVTNDVIELVLQGADGRLIDVEISTKRLGESLIAVIRDITERKLSENILRQSEERFRLLVEGVEDHAIYMLDTEGCIISWNPGAERIYGWTAPEVVSRPESLFYVNGADASSLRQQLHLAATRGHLAEDGWRLRRDGTRFFASVAITALTDGDSGVRGYAVVVRDVTERRAAEAALAHQAMHDDLTGLANRSLFLDRLQLALGRLGRSGTTVAVLFMDLDHFKTINDSLGHRVGDDVLVNASQRLMAAVRPGDTVARFGGDEFVVLCENINTVDDAIGAASRLSHVVSTSYSVSGDEIVVSASIGIALAAGASDDAESLLRDADAALYRAKELGRDRVEVFDDALRARAVERLETEKGLRRAVDREELCIVYQPEIALNGGAVVAVEGLVRWQHPTLGLIGPKQFVPIAEESGLIVPIGNWVIAEACRQRRAWCDEGIEAPTVSVNLSARQLDQRDLVAVVAHALAESGTDPTKLCLEITESVLMDDVESAMITLRALKDLGVQLAVDDFGTGYSSLSYLKRFPVDILKIDQSFVAGVGDDPEDSAIVAAVTKMGHTLGLTVVAEGVETSEQVRALRRLRCDVAQGLFFAPPADPAVTAATLPGHRALEPAVQHS
jgi:diguanylate cyclase (GGDEF)-like protein/PAS domain S-box-containing protein